MEVADFGDTIPAIRDEPLNDAYNQTTPDRNKWLLIHLAAATLCVPNKKCTPRECADLTLPEILKLACVFRLEQ